MHLRLFKKKIAGGGGGGRGGDGSLYIFLCVVGVDIFQIIWVICVSKLSDYMGGGVLVGTLVTDVNVPRYQSKYRIPICLFCCVRSSNLGINQLVLRENKTKQSCFPCL